MSINHKNQLIFGLQDHSIELSEITANDAHAVIDSSDEVSESQVWI